MKIRIAPNGNSMDSDSGRNLGNVLHSNWQNQVKGNELHVELQLPNTHCNVGGTDPTVGQQACLMCPRNLPSFRPDSDRVDEIVQVLRKDLGSISVLRFSGDAEPFWQDRILNLLDDLQINLDSDVKVFTTTNGTLLDRETTDRWFDTVPKSELSFSVDATCPSTYIKLRRIAEFDRVIANIDDYCRTRKPDHHIAVLRNNINTINIDEIQDMIRMTKDYFFHFVVLTPTRPVQSSLNEICLNADNVNRFRDAQAQAKERADEIGVNVVFAGNWP